MPDSPIEHAVFAEGADLAADHKHRRKLPNCANCGFSFASEPESPDNFCPRCGQENHELNVPFKHLVLEFLEGTLHFDSKFFLSLKNLLFRPGLLTKEFNIGRRAGYVPPIRLYVFTSFLFFLLLSWQAAKNPGALTNVKKETIISDNSELKTKSGRSVNFRTGRSGKMVEIQMPDSVTNAISKLKTTAQLDSFLAANKIEPGFISRTALKQSIRLSQGENDKFLNKTIKNTSLLMFLLMPLFGLLLGVAYRSRKRHYVEFLMFALHFHTFLFVVFGLYLLLPDNIDSELLDIAFVLVPVVYLALALRRVYPESWGKVVLKSTALSVLYSLVLGLLLTITMLISFALF